MSGGPRARPRAGRLPADLTTFLGRRQEIAQLKRLLSAARLITLTGVGGTGKTRLAVRVAHEVRRGFHDGACLVNLAPLADQHLVEYAVAEVLGLHVLVDDDPAGFVLGYLRDRRLLLVLDNCEHVLDACAAFVGRALRAAPGVRVLCTSRQPLGINGEHVLRVPPLPVPERGDVFPESPGGRYPSLALFAERAAAVSPGFAVTADNQDQIAEICARLDGLPLAIELAAARLRTLTVDQLAGELLERPRVLSTRHASPSHHRTLELAFDWSFGLCSPAERALWMKLSVFVDGIDLEAAEYVCGGRVLEPLSGLVDKSVLLRDETGGRLRYRLLETVRQYAQRRMAADGEDAVALRRRHRDWFVLLAQRLEAEWFGPDQVDWTMRLRPERGNLRAALMFCLTPDGRGANCALDLAASLEAYWLGGGGLPLEGRYWLTRVLADNPAPTVARARALAVLARVNTAMSSQNPLGAAREALELAERLGATELAARVAGILAVDAHVHGDNTPDVRHLLRTALNRLEPYADSQPAVLVTVQVSIAMSYLYEGAADRAAALCDEAAAYCERRGDRWWRATALMGAGIVAIERGDPDLADRHLRDVLTIRGELGDMLGRALTLDLLASASSMAGRYLLAARLLGMSSATWRALGDVRFGSVRFRERLMSTRTAARTALGPAAFHAAFRSGEQAALDNPGRVLVEPENCDNPPVREERAHSAALTRRERQVAELVAQGMSNRGIADKLVVATRTAESHVENILRKLQFTSRAQVAVWYAETGRET